MLLGIVVKNGIVLIDYTILCRERGKGVSNAVVTAGKSRLRPVLMTTLTTVLGMVPMATGTGEGAEMWRSMGLTVAWGLFGLYLDYIGNSSYRLLRICRQRCQEKTQKTA